MIILFIDKLIRKCKVRKPGKYRYNFVANTEGN
jgi:hypothetical protein